MRETNSDLRKKEILLFRQQNALTKTMDANKWLIVTFRASAGVTRITRIFFRLFTTF